MDDSSWVQVHERWHRMPDMTAHYVSQSQGMHSESPHKLRGTIFLWASGERLWVPKRLIYCGFADMERLEYVVLFAKSSSKSFQTEMPSILLCSSTSVRSIEEYTNDESVTVLSQGRYSSAYRNSLWVILFTPWLSFFSKESSRWRENARGGSRRSE